MPIKQQIYNSADDWSRSLIKDMFLFTKPRGSKVNHLLIGWLTNPYQTVVSKMYHRLISYWSSMKHFKWRSFHVWQSFSNWYYHNFACNKIFTASSKHVIVEALFCILGLLVQKNCLPKQNLLYIDRINIQTYISL